MIITVTSGDTLYSLSEKYTIPISKIVSDNGIINNTLIVGQSLFIGIPKSSFITPEATTVSRISNENNTDNKQVFRNNYFLKGNENIPKDSYIVISYEQTPTTEKIIGGYAYDFISIQRLSSVINYLTYIIPFTYGFNSEGTLIKPDDNYILDEAEKYSVKKLMHISTLTDGGTFDSNLPSLIFDNPIARSNLIDNILVETLVKDYSGVDIDFEYLPESEKEKYSDFISELSERLHSDGKILVVAVPPKTNDEQNGLLVEGIDYEALGKSADYIMIMAYEYGYKFGPPLAIAPENQVRKVLDYAITRIPQSKILLGISNYGYDWTLPYVRGVSDAPSISTVEAIELAKKYGAEIMFDTEASAPFFFYTDEEGNVHEVWFEDARSFRAKINLIEEYNLPGGFIWDLMRENPQGFVTINSLIDIK